MIPKGQMNRVIRVMLIAIIMFFIKALNAIYGKL